MLIGVIFDGKLSAVQSVSLAWDAGLGALPDTGYEIYYGRASGWYTSRVEVGTNTVGTVNGLAEGVTYFFVVKAYGPDGLESGPSNELAYAPPEIVQINMSGDSNRLPQIRFPVSAGAGYELQSSIDLTNWLVVWRFDSLSNGIADFIDPELAPLRWYRVGVNP